MHAGRTFQCPYQGQKMRQEIKGFFTVYIFFLKNPMTFKRWQGGCGTCRAPLLLSRMSSLSRWASSTALRSCCSCRCRFCSAANSLCNENSAYCKPIRAFNVHGSAASSLCKKRFQHTVRPSLSLCFLGLLFLFVFHEIKKH